MTKKQENHRSVITTKHSPCTYGSIIPLHLLIIIIKSFNIICRGNFGEDIGEDFFGFKELGLGQLSVPARLFFGKDKQKNNVVKGPGYVLYSCRNVNQYYYN